jgi:hypothetical protein
MNPRNIDAIVGIEARTTASQNPGGRRSSMIEGRGCVRHRLARNLYAGSALSHPVKSGKSPVSRCRLRADACSLTEPPSRDLHLTGYSFSRAMVLATRMIIPRRRCWRRKEALRSPNRKRRLYFGHRASRSFPLGCHHASIAAASSSPRLCGSDLPNASWLHSA